MTYVVLAASLSCLSLGAAYHDITSRRIPNSLTITFATTGLVIRAAYSMTYFYEGLFAAFCVLLATLPMFVLGGFGGGDVKLVVAVATHFGFDGLLEFALCAGVAGAVLAVGNAVRKKMMLPLLLDSYRLLIWVATLGRRGDSVSVLGTGGRNAIPYGVAISVGALFAWYL